MKRELAAAILTATVAAGAVALPVSADNTLVMEQTACTESFSAPTGNGWQNIGGVWHLIQQDGRARQGWYKDKGQWYFLDNKGAMVTGWTEIDGKVYCFGCDGIMKTGITEHDGEYYLLGHDGAVIEDENEDRPGVSGVYVTISGIVRPIVQ